MTVVGGSGRSAMEPQREREGTLAHVIETLLDKGLVLNADIMVSVGGVELLGIRIRAALASFDTAARYGLEFPAGANTDTVAWRQAMEAKETCPSCGKTSPTAQLLDEYCPWCGWQSARALSEGTERALEPADAEPEPDDEEVDEEADEEDQGEEERDRHDD
jgi:gas vesicle structural protein